MVELSRVQDEVNSVKVVLEDTQAVKRRLEEQAAATHGQLRDKNAEYVEVLNERDGARALLEDERRRRESLEAAQQALDQDISRLRVEMGELQTRASEERSKLESAPAPTRVDH